MEKSTTNFTNFGVDFEWVTSTQFNEFLEVSSTIDVYDTFNYTN